MTFFSKQIICLQSATTTHNDVTFTRPNLITGGMAGGSSFAVGASSQSSNDYAAWKAVDGSSSTLWSPSSQSSSYFIFYNPHQLKVTQLKLIWYNTSYMPSSITVQASNDNSNWTSITSTKSQSSVNTTLSLTNSNFYLYYKLNFQASNYIGLIELQITALERLS